MVEQAIEWVETTSTLIVTTLNNYQSFESKVYLDPFQLVTVPAREVDPSSIYTTCPTSTKHLEVCRSYKLYIYY